MLGKSLTLHCVSLSIPQTLLLLRSIQSEWLLLLVVLTWHSLEGFTEEVALDLGALMGKGEGL